MGIFDADDRGSKCCLDVGLFKAEVGILHAAVYQLQPAAVAQRLCADYNTVFEGQVFGVPSQIFAFDAAVCYRDVTAVPECVLSVNVAVADNCILNVLKRIFAGEFQIMYFKEYIQ